MLDKLTRYIKLTQRIVQPQVKVALHEDLQFKRGDLTTRLFLPVKKRGKIVTAKFIVHQPGVIAGMPVVEECFRQVRNYYFQRPGVPYQFYPHVKEGEQVNAGRNIATLTTSAEIILAGERTALNFLQHLSGIATRTNEYVNKVNTLCILRKIKVPPQIVDTRKTLPGLRILEKYAVLCGNGYNHRLNLSEMVLVKDNHFVLSGDYSLNQWIRFYRLCIILKVPVEIELRSLSEITQFLVNLQISKNRLGYVPEIVMLDNMDSAEIKKGVTLILAWRKKNGTDLPKIEISGGINLNNISTVIIPGIDRISVGNITHSAPALDISLEIVP